MLGRPKINISSVVKKSEKKKKYQGPRRVTSRACAAATVAAVAVDAAAAADVVVFVARDCQGFKNPQGSGVGYMRVRVGVGILYPHETLTPG